MRNRGLREIHAHQILLRRFDPLADRLGNFLRLPRAISDHGGAGISHHHQRGKGEILTSFDNLGDTIDRDYLILKLVRDRKSTRLNSSHRTISYAVFCLKKKKKIDLTYLYY